MRLTKVWYDGDRMRKPKTNYKPKNDYTPERAARGSERGGLTNRLKKKPISLGGPKWSRPDA